MNIFLKTEPEPKNITPRLSPGPQSGKFPAVSHMAQRRTINFEMDSKQKHTHTHRHCEQTKSTRD